MVATTTSIAAQSWEGAVQALTRDLTETDQQQLRQMAETVQPWLAGIALETGESLWDHVLGMALLAAELRLDVASRLAALLYPVPVRVPERWERVRAAVPPEVVRLITGLQRLYGVRLMVGTAAERQAIEALRKMVLAMVEDVRVVLLRLASRIQTLRWFARHPLLPAAGSFALESQRLYAPLANRLGVWRLKWELEDLAFRLLDPEGYRALARQLEERRVAREAFIAERIDEFTAMVAHLGIAPCEVTGRPKHLSSIAQKMARKKLDLSQIYDLRAVRILVPEPADCYTVLAAVHARYRPIDGEFDDYIARPKPNGYQSLHTAVWADDGRPLEVQIRTFAMHHAAEYGIAAHWRYKEGAARASSYDEKIALLRSLLAWRDEVTDANTWADRIKQAIKEEVIYILTPAGRVIDLPKGATPIDFAYRIHTDVGHRCRGAKVDGQIVPLNTPLTTGQRVEILTAKEGGPSRDWLQPGFAVTRHARSKIRLWFVHREAERTGSREEGLRAAGETRSSADLRRDAHPLPELPRATRTPTRPGSIGVSATAAVVPVVVAGEAGFMAQRARCCLPERGEAIAAFISRSRGLTIHRADCPELERLRQRHPERLLPVDWGSKA